MGNKSNRRKVLGLATAFMGGIGVTLAAMPFIRSLMPAADKRLPDHNTDITKLQPGQILAVTSWGRLVYVLKRSDSMLQSLQAGAWDYADINSDNSIQPEGMKNWHRSRHPDLLVVNAQCTHLGCDVGYIPPNQDSSHALGTEGLFFCPCHGSVFDLAGRVGVEYPAQKNLEIPEYEVNDGELTIFHPYYPPD